MGSSLLKVSPFPLQLAANSLHLIQAYLFVTGITVTHFFKQLLSYENKVESFK